MISITNNIISKLKGFFSNGFPALKSRDYRFFWTGQMISVTGTWMQTTAQAWLVLTLTESPLLLGIMGAARFAPLLVLSLFAGVIVDRVPKRTILLITQFASMLLALILAALVFSGFVRYWHVLVLSALLGTVKTFDIPARQAFMIELVGKDTLLNAIALNSSVFNLARIIGPSVAGILTAVAGMGWAFLINGVSFIAVIAGLYMIQTRGTPKQVERTKTIPEIKAGLKYLMSSTSLKLTMAILAVVATFGMNYNVLIPVFAREVLGADATGFGYLMSSLGVGSLIGALFVATRSRGGPRKIRLYILPLVVATLFVLTGLNTSFALSAFLVGLIGFFNIGFTTTANSFVQINTEDRYRGRVMSVYSLVFAGSSPFGNLYVGGIADALGAGASFVIAGLTTGGLSLLICWRRLMIWLRKEKTTEETIDLIDSRDSQRPVDIARNRKSA